jgi:uncharacterized protein YeaO (DUF488 family)
MSRKPEISIKRAYLPADEEDGERILVDRLWPRGISREKLAASWLKDVSPSSALRNWFGHRPERWEEFQRRYRAELDANPQAVEQLLASVARGPVTLVYSARNETHNQAIVLRDYLLEHRRAHR